MRQKNKRKYLNITFNDNAFGFDDEQREQWKSKDAKAGLARRPDGTDLSRNAIEQLVTYLDGIIEFKDTMAKGSQVYPVDTLF